MDREGEVHLKLCGKFFPKKKKKRKKKNGIYDAPSKT